MTTRAGKREAPVVRAAVSVRGRPSVVDTNRQGRFVLTGVPAGEHEVEVRQCGGFLLSAGDSIYVASSLRYPTS
ncbi:MAG: hypothetical protein OXH46_11635 [Gemmatimonadetes bacterium]|nr:hypothetical protein [Gemmatimonadota bacterium]